MPATTFTASGTYTTPAGAAASGSVTFKATNEREANTSTIQDAILLTANLVAGSLSQVLVKNVGGYTVTEKITGADEISYVIPAVANIDLSTVDASTANFDASGVVNVVEKQIVSGTSYIFALADGAAVEKAFTAATTVTATIDGNVVIPVGTVISGIQMGAGKVNVAAANGVTIVSADGDLGTRVRYSPFQIRKDTATQWVLTGDLG